MAGFMTGLQSTIDRVRGKEKKTSVGGAFGPLVNPVLEKYAPSAPKPVETGAPAPGTGTTTPAADAGIGGQETVLTGKKKKAGRYRTTFTSPLGYGNEANLARATLLGQ